MPHLTLEYTQNLHPADIGDILNKLNAATLASGLFEEQDIKARALALPLFRVGTANVERAFVHLKVAILSGRTPELKRTLSAGLMLVIEQAFPLGSIETQFSVEVVDIERESYSKRLAGGAV